MGSPLPPCHSVASGSSRVLRAPVGWSARRGHLLQLWPGSRVSPEPHPHGRALPTRARPAGAVRSDCSASTGNPRARRWPAAGRGRPSAPGGVGDPTSAALCPDRSHDLRRSRDRPPGAVAAPGERQPPGSAPPFRVGAARARVPRTPRPGHAAADASPTRPKPRAHRPVKACEAAPACAVRRRRVTVVRESFRGPGLSSRTPRNRPRGGPSDGVLHAAADARGAAGERYGARPFGSGPPRWLRSGAFHRGSPTVTGPSAPAVTRQDGQPAIRRPRHAQRDLAFTSRGRPHDEKRPDRCGTLSELPSPSSA